MKRGKLVAQIDTGPIGGTGVKIGELLVDGKKLGPVKIPAGLTAELRLSSAPGKVILAPDTSIRYGKAFD